MTKNVFYFSVLMVLISCSSAENNCESYLKSSNQYIYDASRERQIPTQIYALSDSSEWNGELVILNCGYGSSATEYSYITEALAQNGYYVISIQHEIQTDEMIPSGENIIELRMPNWKEGIKSMEQVIEFVKTESPSISTEKVHLIGHSNGGDISVLFATNHPKRVRSLITLDHRRMPIPLSKEYQTLSFRADQFEADLGVIPSKQDQIEFAIGIIYLENVDHNYLRDIATEETKELVLSNIFDFLGT
ncbi:MAG: alpha/beta fold hydrolase [Crocinitomicaceae bacterium]